MTIEPCDPTVTCGISTPLGVLSPASGQVSHALLTRSPLYSRGCPLFRVRLACLIHAANVRSEPGSNSPKVLTSRRSPCRKARTLTLGKSRRLPACRSTRSARRTSRARTGIRALFRFQRSGRQKTGIGCRRACRTRTQKLARGRLKVNPRLGGPLPCCCNREYR